MTPLEWITHHRVHRAARLLERPEMSIEAVAAAAGLGTAANLRARFRRYLGTSPSAYRAAFAAQNKPAPSRSGH